MSERRSRSSVLAEPPPQRSTRLASPMLVAGLGTALVALLLAFHPARQYVQLLQRATPDDPLTSQIAQGVLAEQPHQQQLYPTLIQAELRRNRFADAADLAQQWRGQARSADEAAQAFWLEFEALRQAWTAPPPDSPQRVQRAKPLRSFLLTARHHRPALPLHQTLAMADTANQLLGPHVMDRWLPEPPPAQADPRERLKAARLLLGTATPQRAFAWIEPLLARPHTLTPDELALLASTAVQAGRLDALATHIGQRVRQTRSAAQAGELVRHFLALSARMDRLPQALPLAPNLLDQHPALWRDRDLLIELVRAARASQRPDLAAQWATRLLQAPGVAVRATHTPRTRHGAHSPQPGSGLLARLWPASRTDGALARGIAARVHMWLRAVPAAAGWPALRAQATTVAAALPGAGRARRARTPEHARPFDDEAHTLAWQAFVDHRAFEQAWQVAQHAVQARPGDAQWRLRLAQVSEWHGQPQQALDQWLWLAQQKNLPQAWDGILRLAPGLLQWDALRLAYERRAQREPTPEHLRQLIDLLRQLGESEVARERLAQWVRVQPQPWALDRLARLQAELGRSEAAIAIWRQLAQLQPLDASQAMRLSSLLVVRGELAQALAAQEQAPLPEQPEDRHDVLSMRLELARLLGQVDSGRRSHAALVQGDLLKPEDVDTFHALLERQAPREASQLAVRSWRQFQRPRDLQRALYGLVQFEDWPALDALLADPSAQAQVQARSDWLLLLAQADGQRQRPERAQQALDRALALEPGHTPSQVAALWWLIDRGQTDRLRERLRAWEPALARDPGQHDLLAAAHLTLSQPGIALRRYLLPHAAQRLPEPLWAMTLADAFEQNGQPDQAWQVRQRMWQRLRATAVTPEDVQQPALLRITQARLALQATPGDRSLALLRELLREDTAAAQDGAAVRLLVAAWLQDQGQTGAARAWLWQRTAQSLSRPLWFELGTALQEQDSARLGELLEQQGRHIAPREQALALRTVGDRPAAQTAAFESQALQRDDEALQQALQDLLLEHGRDARIGWQQREDRVLASTTTRAGGQWVAGTRLKLSLQLEQTRHRVQAPAVLAHGATLRSLLGAAQWENAQGSQRLELGQHEGLRRWQHLAWQQQGALGRHTRWDVSAAWRLPGDASPALRVAGRQHQLALRLQHSLSRRDEVALGLQWQAYETQDGQHLGHGRQIEASATHWWRRAPQSLGLDLYARQTQYRFNDRVLDPGLDALAPAGSPLPLDAGFFAVSGGTDIGLRLHAHRVGAGGHSRVWRPYGSLDLVHNSVTGWRADTELGLYGSWLGHDRFHLFWRRSGADNPQTDATRQFGIDHRIPF